MAGNLWAVDTVFITNSDGNTIFELNYYGVSDGDLGVGTASVRTISDEEKTALEKAFDY